MESKIIALIIWVIAASLVIVILGFKADSEIRIQLFTVLIISILIAFKALISQ